MVVTSNRRLFLFLLFAIAAQATERANVGVKLGLNFPYMSYSDGGLGSYPSTVYVKPMFELFGEYKFTPRFSVRPGIKFITRGQHIDQDEFLYRLNADYLELTVPISFTFGSFKGIRPYLLGGPMFGVMSGGMVRYSSVNEGTFQTKTGNGNISSWNFGLYLGGGVNYPVSVKGFSFIPGFEAGYNLGLSDTYSEDEKSGTAATMNAGSYKADGTRKTRGIELGITLSIPFGQFNKKPEPKPEPKPIPVPAPEPIPLDTVVTVIYEEKPCYTLEEMKALIDGEEAPGDMKICAISQISFKHGSYELTEKDKAYLDEIVDLLKRNEQMKIRINGHADNTGEDLFNHNLSHERAKAVYDYFIEKGIEASRLSYAYFGSGQPLRDDDTEEGRMFNRRVEFEIINQ